MGTAAPKAVWEDKAKKEPQESPAAPVPTGSDQLNTSCCHGTQHTGKHQLGNRVLQGWGLGLLSV